MIRREDDLEQERKRIEAYRALAQPAGAADFAQAGAGDPPPIEIHDGEVYDDPSPEEDILEGLDVQGIDPRTTHQEAQR